MEEIEVEEKQKIYVGKHTRIRKDDIGILQSSYGHRMYLLKNTPETYINAMIELCINSVRTAELRLEAARKSLSTWNALAERSGL